jgi:hypothetical protein
VETAEKVREQRNRRAAARQGLKLTRSRRRDPRAIDYARYYLADADTTAVVTYGTLDEIERYLSADWKASDVPAEDPSGHRSGTSTVSEGA